MNKYCPHYTSIFCFCSSPAGVIQLLNRAKAPVSHSLAHLNTSANTSLLETSEQCHKCAKWQQFHLGWPSERQGASIAKFHQLYSGRWWHVRPAHARRFVLYHVSGYKGVSTLRQITTKEDPPETDQMATGHVLHTTMGQPPSYSRYRHLLHTT